MLSVVEDEESNLPSCASPHSAVMSLVIIAFGFSINDSRSVLSISSRSALAREEPNTQPSTYPLIRRGIARRPNLPWPVNGDSCVNHDSCLHQKQDAHRENVCARKDGSFDFVGLFKSAPFNKLEFKDFGC